LPTVSRKRFNTLRCHCDVRCCKVLKRSCNIPIGFVLLLPRSTFLSSSKCDYRFWEFIMALYQKCTFPLFIASVILVSVNSTVLYFEIFCNDIYIYLYILLSASTDVLRLLVIFVWFQLLLFLLRSLLY